MIGKPQWFKRRKYSGWGVFPATWQGWVYIAVVALPIFLIQTLSFLDDQTKNIIFFVWAAVFCADLIDIMIRMPRDERERVHEAVAERNALWVMIAVLVAGVAYQVASGIVTKSAEVDPVIIAALIGAVAAKAITNIYLDRKN